VIDEDVAALGDPDDHSRLALHPGIMRRHIGERRRGRGDQAQAEGKKTQHDAILR
jgi:hypothetical protein